MPLDNSLEPKAQELIDALPDPPEVEGDELRTFSAVRIKRAAVETRVADRNAPDAKPPRGLAVLLPAYARFAIQNAAIGELSNASFSAGATEDPTPLKDSILVRAHDNGVDEGMIWFYRQTIEDALREVTGDDDLATAYFDRYLPDFASIVDTVTRRLVEQGLVEEAAQLAKVESVVQPEDGELDADGDALLGAYDDRERADERDEEDALLAAFDYDENIFSRFADKIERIVHGNEDRSTAYGRELSASVRLQMTDEAVFGELLGAEETLLGKWRTLFGKRSIEVSDDEIVPDVEQLTQWAGTANSLGTETAKEAGRGAAG